VTAPGDARKHLQARHAARLFRDGLIDQFTFSTGGLSITYSISSIAKASRFK
jgi:hypothetical protein